MREFQRGSNNFNSGSVAINGSLREKNKHGQLSKEGSTSTNKPESIVNCNATPQLVGELNTHYVELMNMKLKEVEMVNSDSDETQDHVAETLGVWEDHAMQT